MFGSISKAEEAAYNGEGSVEWDSQNCRNFQKIVLSSSPSRNAVASNLNSHFAAQTAIENDTPNEDPDLEDDQDEDNDLQLLPLDWAPHDTHPKDDFMIEQGADADLEPEPEPEPELAQEELGANVVVAHILDGTQSKQQRKKILKKDSQGRLRLFDHEGNLVQLQQRGLKIMEEDLSGTQKSSMSLTQENSESAYVAYDIKRSIQIQSSTNSLEHGLRNSKNQSLFTDSTAHTYGENDTGHLAFDMGALEEKSPREEDQEDQDEQEDQQSQDPDFIPPPPFPPLFSETTSYEPQTPAPAINPFLRKGSVMKKQDLFGATQASSTIRAAFQSPTSSRPSPNHFNEFATPSDLPSSPTDKRRFNITSSARSLPGLRNSSVGARNSPSQSPAFRTAPENPQSSPPHPPRAYVTMKESQERRKMEEAETESDSDDSWGGEPQSKARKQKINQIIERELSAVETRLTREPSSRPRSSPSAAIEVEVPSTSTRSGRRRSTQEDYIAQCTGQDARDTQQEDVVVDSQVLEADIEMADNSQSISQVAESSIPQPRLSSNIDLSAGSQRAPEMLAPSQMLPLMDRMSTGLMSNLDDVRIPETSPLRSDRIRPMGEMASFTYGGAMEDVDMDELPGFTQDVDFDMAIGNSPESSAPRTNNPIRSQRREIVSLPEPAVPGGNSDISILPEETSGFNRASSEPSIQHTPTIKDLVPTSRKSAQNASTRLSPPNLLSGDTTESITAAKSSSKPAKKQPSPSSSARTSSDTTEAPEPSATHIPDGSARSSPAATPSFMDEDRKSPQPAVESDMTHDMDAPRADNSVAKAPLPKQQNGSLSKFHSQISSIEPMSSALSSVPDYGSDGELIITPEHRDSPDDENIPTSSENLQPDDVDLPTLPASTPKIPTANAKGNIVTYGRKSAPNKLRGDDKSSSPDEDDLATSSPSVSVVAANETQNPKVAAKGRSQKHIPAISTQTKRTSKRRSGIGLNDKQEAPTKTRLSKRRSIAQSLRESSDDPIALGTHITSSAAKKKSGSGIFSNMAFAVSYVAAESDKNKTSKLILGNGGQILEDGFDSLFTTSATTSSTNATELKLLPSAEKIGFTALIANQHSRRAKYIQALALGLPCISGKWISTCVAKGLVVDWSPYLLCAGQSSFLGDACRSRTLQLYPAADARLVDAFESRGQLLNGKSVLLVTGNAKRLESRNTYVFLARALGPARIGHAIDLAEARKMLTEAENQGDNWDMVYVDKVENGADATLFEDTPAGGSRKRKRASTAPSDYTPAPKRVRVICDETIVQSLILGQLMDD